MSAKKKKKKTAARKVAPKAKPKPARRAARKVAPTPKPKPARKVAPKPKPKPARKAPPKPKPARKVAPKPKPARKVAPTPKPKPARRVAPKPKPVPARRHARKVSPKKGKPTAAQRAALALAKSRSKASAKGWLTRKSKAILSPLLGRMLAAREVASALPNDTNEKRAAWEREHHLHAEWYAQKDGIRDVLAQGHYESIVEAVCRDFDIDDYTPFVES